MFAKTRKPIVVLTGPLVDLDGDDRFLSEIFAPPVSASIFDGDFASEEPAGCAVSADSDPEVDGWDGFWDEEAAARLGARSFDREIDG